MGAVNTTYTFTATDTITSTKMNNIIDQTTMTSDAVFTGGTIEVVSGKLRVASGKITSNELASNSVNTDEIVNSAVTTAKLANSTSTTTGVTTAKIADGAITTAKIADSSSTTTGVTTAKIANASITAPKLSGSQTGSAPIYGIRAFASFNGAASSPITTIVEGNIGAITRTATGVYTVTFTTAMPSANYTIMANARYLDNNTYEANCWFTSVTSSSFVLNVAGGGGSYNSERIDLMILA